MPIAVMEAQNTLRLKIVAGKAALIAKGVVTNNKPYKSYDPNHPESEPKIQQCKKTNLKPFYEGVKIN